MSREDARLAARKRAEVTLDCIGDAVLSTDLDGRVTYLNLAAEAMTGWSMEAAEGRPLEDVFHIIDGATREPAPNPMTLAVELDKAVSLTPNCILVRRDGHEVSIEDSAAPIRDRAGCVTGAVIVFRDVGTALRTSKEMAHLAQHDGLTGLPNRLLLHDRLGAAIALAHRHNKPFAAVRLTAALRQSDTVSRLGGDEFVVLLSEIEHTEDAEMLATKILETLARPHRVGSRDVALTASVGVSVYPADGQDADTLLRNADAAMYEAKRSGCGTYRLFDRGTSTRSRRNQVGLG